METITTVLLACLVIGIIAAAYYYHTHKGTVSQDAQAIVAKIKADSMVARQSAPPSKRELNRCLDIASDMLMQTISGQVDTATQAIRYRLGSQ